MSIETLHTTHSTQQTGKGQKYGVPPQGTTHANGLMGGDGSFFDTFLNNAMQALEAQKAKNTEQSVDMDALMKFAKALGAQLSEEAGMDVEIFATNENVQDGTGILDIGALDQQQIDESMLSGQAALMTNGDEVSAEDIPSVMAALGLDDTADIFSPGISRFEKLLVKIEKLANAEAPELSAMNITPEQINALQEQIAAIKAGEDAESTEEMAALMAGLVKILPPQAKPVIMAAGQSLMMSPKQLEILQNQGGHILPGNSMGGKATAPSTIAPLTEDGDLVFFDGDTPNDDAEFQKLLKDFSKTGQDNLLVKANAGADKAAAQGQNLPPAHVLQGWPFGSSGSLFGSMEYNALQYDEMGLSTNGQMSLSSNSPLTSLVTQSQSAGQGHPATQMVAASIQKAASGGEAKNIRIQLDPPELGRVEIKMSFDKNNASKTVLTIEKPETFMMLQRDSHILERALQESGLDMSAEGSLSFEMADDGNFGQDGSHDGNRNPANSAQGDTEGDEEIIETTMNWHVDPSSGHMRYNILA